MNTTVEILIRLLYDDFANSTESLVDAFLNAFSIDAKTV